MHTETGSWLWSFSTLYRDIFRSGLDVLFVCFSTIWQLGDPFWRTIIDFFLFKSENRHDLINQIKHAVYKKLGAQSCVAESLCWIAARSTEFLAKRYFQEKRTRIHMHSLTYSQKSATCESGDMEHSKLVDFVTVPKTSKERGQTEVSRFDSRLKAVLLGHEFSCQAEHLAVIRWLHIHPQTCCRRVSYVDFRLLLSEFLRFRNERSSHPCSSSQSMVLRTISIEIDFPSITITQPVVFRDGRALSQRFSVWFKAPWQTTLNVNRFSIALWAVNELSSRIDRGSWILRFKLLKLACFLILREKLELMMEKCLLCKPTKTIRKRSILIFSTASWFSLGSVIILDELAWIQEAAQCILNCECKFRSWFSTSNCVSNVRRHFCYDFCSQRSKQTSSSNSINKHKPHCAFAPLSRKNKTIWYRQHMEAVS